jgi:hypothetical protein
MLLLLALLAIFLYDGITQERARSEHDHSIAAALLPPTCEKYVWEVHTIALVLAQRLEEKNRGSVSQATQAGSVQMPSNRRSFVKT